MEHLVIDPPGPVFLSHLAPGEVDYFVQFLSGDFCAKVSIIWTVN